jgi:hypothetical protein
MHHTSPGPRHPGTLQFVPGTLIFIAGLIAGGAVILYAMRVQGMHWPLMVGGAFASALLILAWRMSAAFRRIEMPRADAGSDGRAEAQMITICCYCQRILGQDGKWRAVATWLRQSFGLRVSHGICTECVERAASPTAAKE